MLFLPAVDFALHQQPRQADVMHTRLKGLPAILLCVALAVFGGFRSLTAGADLEPQVAQELARRLGAEYVGQQLRGVAVEDLTPAKVDSVLASQNVTFASIDARGRRNDMVVRAEILVDGRPPADGSHVRYYRVSHGAVTGWRVERETTAFAYYSRIF